MYLSIEPFGGDFPGRESVKYTLENANGVCVSCADYGARITDLLLPNANGGRDNVVWGFSSAKAYQADGNYFGATCGRVSGRIARGRFTLSGREYLLSQNEGENTLHGGARGFDCALWDAEFTADGLTFYHISPDGDMGFPGEMRVSATFSLTDDNVLSVIYEAVSDADTPVSLTNHSYFNLDGRGARSVLSHRLTVEADAFCPITRDFLPTGERCSVIGTPFDFTAEREVGERIDERDEQLLIAGGYDHNFALRGAAGTLCRAAVLKSGRSGRTLTLETTLPGLQLYTANALPKDGKYPCRSALCLETQQFPDAVHHGGFPSPILRAGERMRHETRFCFGGML